MLSAADHRRIQRALRKKRHEEDPSLTGELNITPFLDVTVNLILFILATTAVTLTTVEVQARLPTTRPPTPHTTGSGTEAPAALSATLTREGVVLGTDLGFVRAGCGTTGPGASVAVPATAEHAVDTGALNACASALRAALHGTDTVILSAEPDIAYEEVIRAMDALRSDASGPLFPSVIVSAGVR